MGEEINLVGVHDTDCKSVPNIFSPSFLVIELFIFAAPNKDDVSQPPLKLDMSRVWLLPSG